MKMLWDEISEESCQSVKEDTQAGSGAAWRLSSSTAHWLSICYWSDWTVWVRGCWQCCLGTLHFLRSNTEEKITSCLLYTNPPLQHSASPSHHMQKWHCPSESSHISCYLRCNFVCTLCYCAIYLYIVKFNAVISVNDRHTVALLLKLVHYRQNLLS